MNGPNIISSAAVFLVADVPESAAYYRDTLGFTFDRFWGEPPDFCMVWRGQFCIMLAKAPRTQDIRPISGVAPAVRDAYFWVTGVDELHAQLRKQGAGIVSEPVDKPYGVRELVVRDRDGYQIAFGEEKSETQ